MKKFIAAAIVLVTFTFGAGTALAGEVTGNGDPTPIKTRGVAASICAFSGLEDGSPGGPGVQPQTPAGSRGAPGFACSPGRPLP